MSLDRESALEVVRERVDVRFSVSASDFADRLLTLPALITPAGDNPALPRRAGGVSALRALALDDLYLATCCAAGDEGAWREFESKHFSFMRDFARRLLSATASDDLAAQVIADLWQRRKIAQYEGRSTLRTWLGAVVMRAALNARMGPAGQEARLARSEGDARGGRPDRHAGDRSAEEDGRLLARLLGKALERLEDSDRLILLLYYEQGLTLEQIEPILHASKATLSRRLKRLREQLLADVAALARTETGASVDRLRPALERAASEFDLAAALAGRLQGNDRGRV